MMDDRFHNDPPLKDRLEISYDRLVAEVLDAAAQVPAELPEITSADIAGEHAVTAKVLKAVVARVEVYRKKEKEQILKDGRTVDTFFSAMIEPVMEALDRVIAELNRYQTAKLAARRAREEEERKAAVLFDEPVVAPIAVKDAARIVSMEGVKATASRKWTYEIVNPVAVPRQYLQVNEQAIKAAIAGGAREIPGIKIFEQITTSIR